VEAAVPAAVAALVVVAWVAAVAGFRLVVARDPAPASLLQAVASTVGHLVPPEAGVRACPATVLSLR